MSTQAAQANKGLRLDGKNIAVAGGTQGIGRGVGERFAQAGASVWIIGRNARLGNQVVEQLKKQGAPKAEFIEADLSLVSSVKKVAEELKSRTGGQVDFLVTSAGGPPNGKFSLTSEGHEFHFAVQGLSRFALAHLLAESGTLKDAWINICAPGGTKGSPPSLDDLELKSDKERNKWLLGRMLATGSRDSAVSDGLAAHFSTVYPRLRAVHLFPGYVLTDAASNQGFPKPIVWLQSLFSPILSRTIANTPTTYAEVPVYIATHPEARNKGLEFANERLKPLGAPTWTRDNPELRAQLWDKMKAMVDQ
ncbi:hypothetical protein OIO90_003802 [Microbotryomycetes sp. JL221]|nr:hypothetical protein OIO90_003802 [Microbotryomycetes sp. JL221]